MKKAPKQLAWGEILLAAGRARAEMKKEGLSLAFAVAAGARDLPPVAQGTLQAILFLGVRRQALSELILRTLAQKLPPEPVRSVLELAVAELMDDPERGYMTVSQTVEAVRRIRPGMAKFANALLRRTAAGREEFLQKAEETPEVRWNAPRWWIERLRAAWPEAAEGILRAGTLRPPMTLRINLRRTSVEDYLRTLERSGLAFRHLGREAVMLEKPLPVSSVPGFALGLVSVQDAGAQLAAHLLPVRAGERVLDACSAPGGKAAHLLERQSLDLTALEVSAERTEKIHETLSRLGLSARVRTGDASRPELWWDGAPFDAVLLDAPCTASGIVCRQPDVPWNRRPGDIDTLARTQHGLLEALWPTLRKGGKLLYCTCSVFPEEGERQAERFLAEHAEARLAPCEAMPAGMMRLLPAPQPGEGVPPVHDGFFYALFEKP